MRSIQSKRTVAVLAAAGFVAFTLATSLAAEKKDDKKPKYTAKEVMEKGHKGKDSLVQKVIGGKASDAEKKDLLEMYESLALVEAPKGDKASWKTKTAALVKAAEGVVKGEKGAADKLKSATNCRACHTAHRPN